MSADTCATMFEVGDAVSFDDVEGRPQKRYRVTDVVASDGEILVRFLPVLEPARDGEEAEA